MHNYWHFKSISAEKTRRGQLRRPYAQQFELELFRLKLYIFQAPRKVWSELARKFVPYRRKILDKDRKRIYNYWRVAELSVKDEVLHQLAICHE